MNLNQKKLKMNISKGAVKSLRDLYFGELVVIYLRGMNIVVQQGDDQMDVTPMLQGIIMDIDQSFIHLGDGDQIHKSVKHNDYGVIELASMPEPLINFDMANDDSEIN